MTMYELREHVMAIKEYCDTRESCVGCPLDGNVCTYPVYSECTPGDWVIPEEYKEREE